MNRTEVLENFDGNRIRSFLKTTDYRDLNRIPGTDRTRAINHRYALIERSFAAGKTFVSQNNSRIIALATLEDLDWDTRHFGYRCAKINSFLLDETADSETRMAALDGLLTKIEGYATASHIKFICVSIDSWQSSIATVLQDHHFKYILTWIDGIYASKKELKVNLKDSNHEVGRARKSELEYFSDLAANHYFKGGRFYLDPNIDDKSTDEMYAHLIASAYTNQDRLFAYRIGGQPVGLFIYKKDFTYAHFDNLKASSVRLFTVDPKVRQKGIGYDFFASTLNDIMRKVDIVLTGLEIHNLPSLNLHRKIDFRFNFTHNVYHWWS